MEFSEICENLVESSDMDLDEHRSEAEPWDESDNFFTDNFGR